MFIFDFRAWQHDIAVASSNFIAAMPAGRKYAELAAGLSRLASRRSH